MPNGDNYSLKKETFGVGKPGGYKPVGETGLRATYWLSVVDALLWMVLPPLPFAQV